MFFSERSTSVAERQDEIPATRRGSPTLYLERRDRTRQWRRKEREGGIQMSEGKGGRHTDERRKKEPFPHVGYTEMGCIQCTRWAQLGLQSPLATTGMGK